MEKTGKRRTGRPSSLAPKAMVQEFEHLPAVPLNVIDLRRPKLPKMVLAQRSLLSVAFQHIKPNWRSYIMYVDMAARGGNEKMKRYRGVYESLPSKERAAAWPEQLCDLAEITPRELYEAVCGQMWDSKAAESSMMCSLEHPQVLGAMIKYAKEENHYQDRELFLRATGSLPDKKGASINIFNQAAGIAAGPALDGQPPRARLRSFDEEIVEMSRDLEAPEAPFRIHENVPPEDN